MKMFFNISPGEQIQHSITCFRIGKHFCVCVFALSLFSPLINSRTCQNNRGTTYAIFSEIQFHSSCVKWCLFRDGRSHLCKFKPHTVSQVIKKHEQIKHSQLGCRNNYQSNKQQKLHHRCLGWHNSLSITTIAPHTLQSPLPSQLFLRKWLSYLAQVFDLICVLRGHLLFPPHLGHQTHDSFAACFTLDLCVVQSLGQGHNLSLHQCILLDKVIHLHDKQEHKSNGDKLKYSKTGLRAFVFWSSR